MAEFFFSSFNSCFFNRSFEKRPQDVFKVNFSAIFFHSSQKYVILFNFKKIVHLLEFLSRDKTWVKKI